MSTMVRSGLRGGQRDGNVLWHCRWLLELEQRRLRMELHEAGFIDQRDYETYIGHFNIMKRFLVYPDVLIYLRVNPEVSMQRIQERGRDAESRITLEYMEKLHQGYESFITEMDHYTRVLTLDWNEYKEPDEVARLVKKKADENREFLRDLKRL